MNQYFVVTSRLLCASAAALLLALTAGCGQTSTGKVVSVDESTLTISQTSFIPDEQDATTTYHVAADAKVTRNGAPAVVTELKQGDAVNVVSESRNGEAVATKIDAQSVTVPVSTPPPDASPMTVNEQEENAEQPMKIDEPVRPQSDVPGDPPGSISEPPVASPPEPAAKRFDGTLMQVEGGSVVVRNKEGDAQTFEVAEDVVVTLDGKSASMSDLAPDLEVQVSVEPRNDILVASRIDAETPE